MTVDDALVERGYRCFGKTPYSMGSDWGELNPILFQKSFAGPGGKRFINIWKFSMPAPENLHTWVREPAVRSVMEVKVSYDVASTYETGESFATKIEFFSFKETEILERLPNLEAWIAHTFHMTGGKYQ